MKDECLPNFRNKPWMKEVSLFITSLLISCGIEVGNPTDDSEIKPKTGMVQIKVVSVNADDLEELTMNITSLSLIDSSSSELVVDSRSNSLTLTQNEDSQTFDLASGIDVPNGDYKGVSLTFEEGNIGKVKKGGIEKPMLFASSLQNQMDVEQDFEVKEGEDNELIIHIDVENKLTLNDDQKTYSFRPHSNLFVSSRNTEITGQGPLSELGFACLYQKSGNLTLNRPPKPRKPRPGVDKRFSSRRPAFEKLPQFANRAAKCRDATIRIPLREGKFKFKHLLEGSYYISLYYFESQQWYESETVIEVKQEESVKLKPEAFTASIQK